MYAQRGDIKLRQAKRLKGSTINGKRINRVIGDVIFEHKGTMMYCDSAHQYAEKNEIHAFGHIKVIQKKDNITLYGDKLIYYGDKRLAKVRENVILNDNKSTTLTTDFLDYDMKNRKANYFNGGSVKDNDMNLVSEIGYYNMVKDFYSFKNDVKVNRPDYKLESDTLVYYKKSKMTEFFGPTNIYSDGEHLYAEKGKYYTETKRAFFRTNARMENEEYIIEGDSLYFDNLENEGYAYKNVILISKKEATTITGNELFRWGKIGKSKVIGDAIMRKYEPEDTLYLSSDTLISIQDTINKNSHIESFGNVLLWKYEMQAKCDSLVYHMDDSTMQFYQKPILWNKTTQITADTILVELKNDQIDKMFLNVNSFLISEDQDDTTNFNQIKGKNMVALFKNNDLSRVDVFGNGESIYFAKNEEDNSLMGMNNVICSNMIILFEKNELNKISFLTDPDAKFIPPINLSAADKQLKNFNWMMDQKPSVNDVLRIKEDHTLGQSKTEKNKTNSKDLSEKESKKLSKKEARKKEKERKRLEKEKKKEERKKRKEKK